MKTLREQLNFAIYDSVKPRQQLLYEISAIAKQMDALLEECYQALQCPIKSQVMIELLRNNGYGDDTRN